MIAGLNYRKNGVAFHWADCVFFTALIWARLTWGKRYTWETPWEKCSFVCGGEMGGRSVRSLKETCMILHASQYAHKTNQHASRKPYHILQHSQRQKHPISVQNVTERHTIVIQVGFKMIALCGVCNVNVNDRETYLTIYVHVPERFCLCSCESHTCRSYRFFCNSKNNRHNVPIQYFYEDDFRLKYIWIYKGEFISLIL